MAGRAGARRPGPSGSRGRDRAAWSPGSGRRAAGGVAGWPGSRRRGPRTVRVLRHARRIQDDDRPPGKAGLDHDERHLGDWDAERQQEDVAQGQALAELGRVQHARGAADAIAPGAALDAAEQAEEAGPPLSGRSSSRSSASRPCAIAASKPPAPARRRAAQAAARDRRCEGASPGGAAAAWSARPAARAATRAAGPDAVPHARGVAQIDHLGGPAPAVAVAENEARQQGIEQGPAQHRPLVPPGG